MKGNALLSRMEYEPKFSIIGQIGGLLADKDGHRVLGMGVITQ
jgi:hypothetical protein